MKIRNADHPTSPYCRGSCDPLPGYVDGLVRFSRIAKGSEEMSG